MSKTLDMIQFRYIPFIQFVLVCSLFVCCHDKDEQYIIVSPSITIKPDTISLARGESFQLKAQLKNISQEHPRIIWSSNSNTVTVDSTGLVTVLMVNDVFNIDVWVTAKLENTDVYGICVVKPYQNYNYVYRLQLKDKGQMNMSIAKPDRFLSLKAIERRKDMSIDIDDIDLPISSDYIKKIEEAGGVVVTKSKWLETVCVQFSDTNMVANYKALPFVEDVILVARYPKESAKIENTKFEQERAPLFAKSKSSSIYGTAWDNISTNNGQVLHENGFKGKGINIAVIDGSFAGLHNNPSFNDISILGAKSFIFGNEDLFDINDQHGSWVVSCMATNKPNYYIGTAPEASYWLLRSEDYSSEFPIEEDYWVSAIEFADSVGVDIVNTSLYYVLSDWPIINYYRYESMDGKTLHATRGANIAAQKGIFIVCCAGNHHSWVGSPSDSPNVLTVGSVWSDGTQSNFSASGITIDGRIKPDVMALGVAASVIGVNGNAEYRSGTSYSSPIICGLAACLWQAYPQLSNNQLLDILRKSSNNYDNPILPYGYGIPDMKKAIELAEELITP